MLELAIEYMPQIVAGIVTAVASLFGYLQYQAKIKAEAQSNASELALETTRNDHEERITGIKNDHVRELAQTSLFEKLLEQLATSAQQNKEQHDSHIETSRETIEAIRSLGDSTTKAIGAISSNVERNDLALKKALALLPSEIAEALQDSFQKMQASLEKTVEDSISIHEASARTRFAQLQSDIEIKITQEIDRVDARITDIEQQVKNMKNPVLNPITVTSEVVQPMDKPDVDKSQDNLNNKKESA